MATLSELQAQKAALEEARGSGELRIRTLDNEVTYRSMDEIDRALASVDDAIARVEGTPRRYQVRVNSRKGW